MKDLIQSAIKILIVLPKRINFDIASACIGLAKLLSKDKKIEIGSATPLPSEFNNLLNLTEFKFIDTIQKPEVIISLNREKGDVGAVRWRERDNKIQFIITPQKGKLEIKDVDLTTTGADYDLVITLCCQDLSSAGDLYTSNPNFFHETKIINIDTSEQNAKFGAVNEVANNTSVSGLVLDILERENFGLDKEAVESLFKGIFWAHEGFRQKDNIRNALKTATSAGVDITQSISEIFNTLTIGELRYMGKMIGNMKISTNGIIVSKISVNDIQGVNLERVIYPEVNIISRLSDYKFAVLLAEEKPQKVWARIYSHDESTNLSELFTEFSPQGNSQRVHFHIDGSLDEIEEKVTAKLTQSLPPTTAKSERPEEPKESTQEEKRASSKEKKEKEPLKKAAKLPEPEEAPLVPPIPTMRTPPVTPAPSTFVPPPPIQPLPRRTQGF